METPKERGLPDLEALYDHPTFTQHLNNVELSEKGRAVFECKVEPSKDPTLKIGKHKLSDRTLLTLINTRLGTEWETLAQRL